MANVTTSAETNVIKKANSAKVREVDFAYRFVGNGVNKLMEILGITRPTPVAAGTELVAYTASGSLESGAVGEGEIIPLSAVSTSKVSLGAITLNKWRKAVTAEAIQKSGYDHAVELTNDKLLRLVQNGIRTQFVTFMSTAVGSTASEGTGLQEALADAWGKLQVKFEDDDIETVYFVNPTDIANYLKTAQITIQTAFGFSYIEDFLGLGTVIMTNKVSQGTFYATAKENLVAMYIDVQGGLDEAFDFTTDETGLVGIHEEANYTRMQSEVTVISGLTIFAERVDGVIVGTINGTLPELNVYSAAGASSGKTAITYTGYTKGANDVLKYKVTDDVIVVTLGQSVSAWTTWNGSDDITAATGKIITLAVADSSGNVLAAGHATVTSHA